MSPKLDDIILRFVDGVASATEREQLQQATRQDSELQRRLERTRSIVAGLGDLEVIDPPRDLVATARAAAGATPSRLRLGLLLTFATASAALAIIVFSLVRAPSDLPTSTPVARMVASAVTGDVTHVQQDGERQAAVGDIVTNGQQLTTGTGAMLTLTLARHQFTIDEKSSVEIIDTSLGTPSLMLQHGVARVAAHAGTVESRLRGLLHRVVVTNGEAGLLHDQSRTVVTCIAGTVSITGPQVSEILIAGQEIDLRNGGFPVASKSELQLEITSTRAHGDTIDVVGHTNPNSQVWVNDELLAVDEDGRFSSNVPVSQAGSIEIRARDASMRRQQTHVTWDPPGQKQTERPLPHNEQPIETKWRWQDSDDR